VAAKAKPKAKKIAAPKPAPALPDACKATLSKEQIAHALTISKRYLDQMVSAGEFPPPDFHIGSMRRWRVETYNAWVDKQGPIHARGVQAES